MSETTYYAHTTDKTDKSDWHLLKDHLLAVGALAAEMASPFGFEEFARCAGMLHDLGKYCAAFQRRLLGDSTSVDHSTAGAVEAVRRFKRPGLLIAYGIAGHHCGLANGRGSEARIALQQRLEPQPKQQPLFEGWTAEVEVPMELSFPRSFRPDPTAKNFQLGLAARMLFSCLVDADYSDTDRFYSSVEGRPSSLGARPNLEALRIELDTFIASLDRNGVLAGIRQEIALHARKQADTERGIFSFTVPTGGGKTLASLGFALDHAIAHGMSRIIYTVPFTSVVEQTAQVFRDAFGVLGEMAVLEHHSAFIDPPDSSPEALQKVRRAMENWDAPIVVTTSVQLFESLYANRPSKCRKIHNIANSVIILDEAQALPLGLLRPCVAVLKELALNYRVSVVLCTATQPVLRADEGGTGGFPGGFVRVRELAPDPEALFTKMKRTTVRAIGDASDEDIVRRFCEIDQMLCIVNNRKHARSLFDQISGLPGVFHLSTLMCAKHRSAHLRCIKERLKAGEPCRLVATSLVEAGVDIDFPYVLRAEAGLDSIAQAAGRCNREGRLPSERSFVDIFRPSNPDWAAPIELTRQAQVAREVIRNTSSDILSLDVISSYFKLLYWQKGTEALDKHNILGRFTAGGLEGLPFETVSRLFRMIESAYVPLIVPYDLVAREALRKLKFVDRVGSIARTLQPYTVQVSECALKQIVGYGAAAPVNADKFGNQFLVLVNEALYNESYGIDFRDPSYRVPESNIW